MDVVTLRDQMVRVERPLEIILRVFHSIGREYEPGRLYVVLRSELTEKVGFSGSKRFNLPLGMDNKICSR